MTTPSRLQARKALAPSTINIPSKRHTRSSSSLHIPSDGLTDPRTSKSKSPLKVLRSKSNGDENQNAITPSVVADKKVKGMGVDSTRLGRLERKVERNDQLMGGKISALEDRFTELQTHVLYVLSRSPCPSHANPGSGEVDYLRSPPVPALKRKLKEAELERSFTLNGNEKRQKVEVVEDGGQVVEMKLEDLQVKSLSETVQLLRVTTDRFQFDLDAGQGQVADMEGRVDNLEEGREVGEASMLINGYEP
uniref:Uncharacterized protein n=1 Tax=Kwoniella bestiolae CBS 10118 TaxID=1296100 RepID=A0A1B9FRY4_9TREE|nr:hypothetical protein I302_09216 [Kwoniella bestiolae CBS 10118]OCF21537.1 hypothetical protein I302_09216 [Kwoniella bestiolae CBS 10118]